MSRSLREVFNRMRSFFRKGTLDRELDEEIATHVEMAVEENRARGLSAEEARRQALIRLGGVQQARETYRDSRGLPWLDVLSQDLHFTFRTLRRDSRSLNRSSPPSSKNVCANRSRDACATAGRAAMARASVCFSSALNSAFFARAAAAALTASSR